MRCHAGRCELTALRVRLLVHGSRGQPEGGAELILADDGVLVCTEADGLELAVVGAPGLAAGALPVAAALDLVPGVVRHTFTHFHLELLVAVGRARPREDADGFWCSLDGLADQALPTVMKKVVAHALLHTVL